ncbi:MAG: hypothetical protein IKX20_04630 [Paludibacteraceae bacterium]|nr:hypothetical protein [Paludibacteraceae bacterium]
MDRKEKKEKRSFIGSIINLANGKFKDDEIDTLYDLAKNCSDYNGKSKTYKSSFDSWCSDGKYTRDEETTYTFRSDDRGVRIEEHYQYHDDDGQSGSSNIEHDTARGILNLLSKIFGK